MTVENPDIILIGSGIMSSNLGALLKRLDPALSIQVYEVSESLAQESSNGWNNAGTGHAGICELSYTPHREADGTVNVTKAIGIFEEFSHSKQFWGHATASGMISQPQDFIRPVPHVSFVHGQEQVDYLKARYEGLAAHHFFRDMQFTTDRATIATWAPLLMEGRGPEPVAATWMAGGTDVNFGVISRKLLGWLGGQDGCGIATNHRVTGLQKTARGWQVTVQDLLNGEVRINHTRFVFIGAGGGTLPLLQRSGIPEAKGLGGFPIGGQWLICRNPDIIARHHAKVYGQALAAAPTMAVPHLDTRQLDGRPCLLFGPFAAWTTKFLHRHGRVTDLPFSVRPDNLATLLRIGYHNVPLVRYLVQQGTQSMEDRMDVLRVFYPAAQARDWKLIDAGIRVQAIKKTDGQAGIVHYGTEVITDSTCTLSALLGASPGASVSVNIVLQIIRKCFPELLSSQEGMERLKAMIPSHNEDLRDPGMAARYQEINAAADTALQLG